MSITIPDFKKAQLRLEWERIIADENITVDSIRKEWTDDEEMEELFIGDRRYLYDSIDELEHDVHLIADNHPSFVNASEVDVSTCMNVNLITLRKQKALLLELAELGEKLNDAESANLIDGLIGFLDAYQDRAAKQHGDLLVFGLIMD